jgi:nucleoside-diphosphate-sugar epimerase
MSTTDVYGIRDFSGAGEDTPLANNRRNPYPKYKILAEEHIRRSLPADRYVILRPAFVWGPGDTTLMPRAIAFLRASPVIVHFGPWRGHNRWPLAYVGNVARVAWAAATSDAAPGEAYNVVDPEPTSVDDYYRLLIDLFLPERSGIRSLSLPLALAWPTAALSTAVSKLLNRQHPIYDPSLYGLWHLSHSQDFSGQKAARLLAGCGDAFINRRSALEELRAQRFPGVPLCARDRSRVADRVQVGVPACRDREDSG